MTTPMRAAQFEFGTDADAPAHQDSVSGAALVSARRKHRRARKLARRAKLAVNQSTAELRRLFVYGTLLAGEPEHRHLLRAWFLREAQTPPTFQLYRVAAGPALVRGGTQSIQGELYEMETHFLSDLDRNEHPLQRTSIALDDGSEADAYVLPRENASAYHLIFLNDWRTRWREPPSETDDANDDEG